jgi:hypothetical protein
MKNNTLERGGATASATLTQGEFNGFSKYFNKKLRKTSNVSAEVKDDNWKITLKTDEESLHDMLKKRWGKKFRIKG